MIEVGEYVRTVDGKIGIFIRYSSRKEDSLYKSPANCFVKFTNRKSNLQCFSDYIKKHSKNIIDLIEVGDVVKTYYVSSEDIIHIWNEEMLEALKEDVEDGVRIKSIVTKEQFESVKYEVNLEEVCEK